MLRSFSAVAALVLVGCGSGDGDGSGQEPMQQAVCEAGRVAECPCSNGATATQACKDDGSGWDECACTDPRTLSAMRMCSGTVDSREVLLLNGGFGCPRPMTQAWRSCPEELVTSKICEKEDVGSNSPFFCCLEN